MNNEIEFQKLAHSCRFQIKEEELEYVKENFDILNKQIEVLNKIDTDNVTEMIYPFEEEVHFLREDVVVKTLSKEDVLKNAKTHDDSYIIVETKVVE